MSAILDTEMLKQHLLVMLRNLTEITGDYNMSLSINFFENDHKQHDAVYVYSKDRFYHIEYVEKGRVNSHVTTQSLDEIIFPILGDVIRSISLKYAALKEKEGKDFTEHNFMKKLELWRHLGEKYYQMQMEEIKDVEKKLKRNVFRSTDVTN